MKRQRLLLIGTFSLALMAVFVLSYVYISRISNAIKRNSISNIKELTMHDIKQTEAILERTWGELISVVDRIQIYRCKSIGDVQERLTIERQSSSFYSIYLIDDMGNIYTDALVILPKSKQFIWALFDRYRERSFTVRYIDTNEISELRKSTLLYGAHIDPFCIGDVNFTGVVGLKKISDIQTQMRIESFEGRGYTNIIDTAGEYIVSKTLLSGINNSENFFENLGAAKILDTNLLQIKSRMDYKESICFSCMLDNGRKSLIYMSPMNKLSWYFITIVSYEVLLEQSRFFIGISAFVLLMTLIIIATLIILLFHSRQRTLQSNALVQARSEFLSNMSHEIRTPLNGLIGLNHLMTIHIDSKELLQNYLAKSSSTAKYLLSLVNDILDVSKLQAGKVELVRETVDLGALVDKVFDMQQENMRNRSIDFSVKKDLPHNFIIADNVRLTQILMNLLGNAAKFTQKGGKVRLYASEKIVKERLVNVTFEVKDNGCGISEEFKSHIFESFSQDNANRTASLSGTGLGLSICNMLTRLMGGSISVESVLGEGSCFTVVFPAQLSKGQNVTGFELDTTLMAKNPPSGHGVMKEAFKSIVSNASGKNSVSASNTKQGQDNAQAKQFTQKGSTSVQQQEASQKSKESAGQNAKSAAYNEDSAKDVAAAIELQAESPIYRSKKGGQPPTLNILIAEDNELNAEILVDILQVNGFTCLLAHDGFEAVSVFSNSAVSSVDAILMDVQMPRMNGYEAAKTIRALDRADAKTVPIFACTANTFKEDKDKAYLAGMNDFLGKPIDISEMLQKLRMI